MILLKPFFTRQWLSKLSIIFLGTAMHPLTDYVTELTTTEKGLIISG
jgi:hypothetical protein